MAKGAHFDGQRAVDVEGAGGDGVADLARLRQVLAGEQGLINAGLAIEDHAVCWQHRARMHQHAVAQGQFAQQDAFALAVVFQAQARRRQQVDQLRSGRRRALPGTAFQVATGQQEQCKHAHCIEIQLADAGDRGPYSRQISPANGEGY